MSLNRLLEEKLKALEASQRYRTLHSPSGMCFVDNDYLGLRFDKRIREAGQRALSVGGSGSGGSRLLGGHLREFDLLEQKLAAFFGAPAALFFSTGYLANLALVGTLSRERDLVVSDALNHASLIDGIRLGGAKKQIIPHNSWSDVNIPAGSLLVSESLFSMDGDLVDKQALESKMESDQFLIIDEAHAVGVFGEKGEGIFGANTNWESVAKVVTFGKAFGVSGAAVLCSQTVREWIINSARPFIYTTAPSPVVAAMVSESVDIVCGEHWRRTELQDRAKNVRSILAKLEPSPVPKPRTSLEECSPIVPFAIEGDERVLRFSKNMRDLGVDLRAIRYPTVAVGEERLRISLNLNASRDNTLAMAELLVKQWTEFL